MVLLNAPSVSALKTDHEYSCCQSGSPCLVSAHNVQSRWSETSSTTKNFDTFYYGTSIQTNQSRMTTIYFSHTPMMTTSIPEPQSHGVFFSKSRNFAERWWTKSYPIHNIAEPHTSARFLPAQPLTGWGVGKTRRGVAPEPVKLWEKHPFWYPVYTDEKANPPPPQMR